MGDGDWWIALLAMDWRTSGLEDLDVVAVERGLGVRAALYFGALRLGYLWLYGCMRVSVNDCGCYSC
jgi:hypothetical protein